MDIKLFDLYNTNKDFKEYVDKYAKCRGKLFPEDCFADKVVQNYAEYLRGGKRCAKYANGLNNGLITEQMR